MPLKPRKIVKFKLKQEDVDVNVKPFTKEYVPFSFSLISRDDDVAIGGIQEEESRFLGTYPTNAYEEYKFIFYAYNFFLHKYKAGNKYTSKYSFNRNMLNFFNHLYVSVWKNIPEFKRYSLTGMEKEIDKLPGIRTIIETAVDSKGWVSIPADAIDSNKEYCAIIEKYAREYLNVISNWLQKIDCKKLKRAYYTDNLYEYMQLLGVTDKKIIDLAEYHLYKNIQMFNNYLPDMYNTKLENKLIQLNYGNINQDLVQKYSDILFNCYENKRDRAHQNICLTDSVLVGCFKKFKNKESLLSFYVPTLQKTELNDLDFKHIAQYDYIRSLLSNGLKKNIEGINILLWGPPGSGKSSLARVLLHSLNASSYEVGIRDMGLDDRPRNLDWSNNDNGARQRNFMIMRAILNNNNNSALLYDEAEDFFRKRDEVSQSKGSVNEILEKNKVPTIWTTNSLHCMEESFLRRFTYILHVDDLPQDVYVGMIDKLCNKYKVTLTEKILDILKQYKPNLGTLDKTLKNYKLSASKDLTNLQQDLVDSLLGQRHGEPLDKIASNKFNFNPALLNASENLVELTSNIKSTNRLDFSLLLYGVPGSSKTSYGRYLAQELGMKVINKTYTELSSMWVGETEKNIKALFDKAEKDKAFIILDEVDVLLQDRTKARASWEISATEALLTCMEEHSYPFVMTTNLYENLDPAVMRRILYKVKHDYLTEEQVILAFKHFFDLKITDKLYLSKLTSGDFAVIKKQAEFQGKLNDKDWLIQKLTDEMNQKKMQGYSNPILM